MNYPNKRNLQYRKTELHAHRARGTVFLLSMVAILFVLGAFGVLFF